MVAKCFEATNALLLFQGTRVHYRSAGPADGGKILFLLHGSAFNSQHWKDIETIQTMAAAGNRVYAVDLPGKRFLLKYLHFYDWKFYFKFGAPVQSRDPSKKRISINLGFNPYDFFYENNFSPPKPECNDGGTQEPASLRGHPQIPDRLSRGRNLRGLRLFFRGHCSQSQSFPCPFLLGRLRQISKQPSFMRMPTRERRAPRRHSTVID